MAAKSTPKRLPEAISINKTAEILGVCPLTVRRWINRGWIVAIRVGPWLVRIPRSEILRMRTIRIAAKDNVERPRYLKV